MNKCDKPEWYDSENAQQSQHHGENSFGTKRRWSEEEKRKVMAQDIPDEELSKQIGRSVAAIQNMRAKIRKQQGRNYDENSFVPNRRWSEEEKRKVLVKDIPDEELSKQIGRSVHTIRSKRYLTRKQQNLSYGQNEFAPRQYKEWSEEEKRKVLAKEIPDWELSEQLGRSYTSILEMRYKMRKQSQYHSENSFVPNRRWSEEEKRKVMAQDIPDKELSKQLGRSVAAIKRERYVLRKQPDCNYGENSFRTRRPWSEEEKRKVLAKEIPDWELSKQLGRSYTSIFLMRYRLEKELAKG